MVSRDCPSKAEQILGDIQERFGKGFGERFGGKVQGKVRGKGSGKGSDGLREMFGRGRERNGLIIREEKGQIREKAYGKKEK